MKSYQGKVLTVIAAAWLTILPGTLKAAESANRVESSPAGSNWVHDNLLAWCVVPYDADKRGPEERALMLKKLGFKHFAYDWRENDVPFFEAEVEALKKQGIDLTAWWFPLSAENPRAKEILEIFKRQQVHPQLWVSHFVPGMESLGSILKQLPEGAVRPQTPAEFAKLSEKEKALVMPEVQKIMARLNKEDTSPKTPAEQEQRVKKEADQVAALAALARPYGCQVMLYNHNGWFGMVENQVAIIEHLRSQGVADVGMIYNFSHARDESHDDSRDFAAIWKKITPYVKVVNITGMKMEGQIVYPSQGDSELEMMRIIQASGWRGVVGVIAEKGGDAEVTLGNYLRGLDWLAAELKQPGSGGPAPFPVSSPPKS